MNGNGLPDECECVADLNGSGSVDIIDFLQLLAVWGPCEPGCFGDVDFDGNVGIVDFLALLAQWGGRGSCDFHGRGVGINDFLALLANWGSCP